MKTKGKFEKLSKPKSASSQNKQCPFILAAIIFSNILFPWKATIWFGQFHETIFYFPFSTFLKVCFSVIKFKLYHFTFYNNFCLSLDIRPNLLKWYLRWSIGQTFELISEAFSCNLSFPPSDIFILSIDHDSSWKMFTFIFLSKVLQTTISNPL